MKKILILFAFVLLVACGSNPNKVAAIKVGDELYKPDNAAAMAIDTGNKDEIVCKRRIVTGSHRKQKACTTRTEMERERVAAQERITNNDTMNVRKDTASKGGN
ncbi:hypothetical protein [Marinicella meishanensis]|uniref:hypothetical protein n=1 Tax=Marinicella meishanensis TaxID=2873263 RepID=UPI001CBFEC6F|nr:hypothetical protein [Marinicella sp. NBU2979]